MGYNKTDDEENKTACGPLIKDDENGLEWRVLNEV
jgi:hypothetical protein